MTTTSIRISYPRSTERMAARIGRALVRWADDHAIVSRDRHGRAVENELALAQRSHRALQLQHLRG